MTAPIMNNTYNELTPEQSSEVPVSYVRVVMIDFFVSPSYDMDG